MPTTATWSAQQREWLQALGYDVLVLAAADAAPELPQATSRVEGASRGSVEDGSAGHASAAHGPAKHGSSTPARTDGGALLRAVLHAAGRRELGELVAWLPDPSALRGDPAAKRALWPRLRALRAPARRT